MTEEKGKILDLDELFGQARAVKVRWLGKEYELLKLEGISPRQSVKFQQMQMRANVLQNAEGTDEQADEVEKLLNEMLKMLCAELPVETIPFMAKTRVMGFYIEETQGKKALETALSNATGEKSSAV